MKKILLVLMGALTLGVDAHAAVGDRFTAGDLKYQVLDEEAKTALVEEFIGSPTEVAIPETVNGYTIVRIGGLAFQRCTSLTVVTIPESVTEISEQAFDECTSLTSVTIPNSVTEIGDYAFTHCSSLATITLPNSLTAISYGMFRGCDNLASITIPESVTKIDVTAFQNCSSLASVVIPNSVTEIGSSAFESCSSLTSLTIPNSVTEIGRWVFGDCGNLHSIIIPESITNIPNSAFNGCVSLISVVLPASLTEIDDYAFYECYKLANIYCYAVNPPEINIGVFEDLEVSKINLHVLENAVASYKEARVWIDFNIVGDLTAEAGIDGVEADGFGAVAEYFNLGGVRVNADSLTPGLYIKRQGGKAEKMLVK